MSFHMAQVPAHLKPTDLTLTEETFAMNLLHMTDKLKLISKFLVTGWAIYRLPGLTGRRGSRLRGRGTNGRRNGNRP